MAALSFWQLFILISLISYQSSANSKFDATTSTTQILQSLQEDETLTGKLAIVTGATSGLGNETTRSLALLDCTVIMAVRDIQKGENVRNQIISSVLEDEHKRTSHDNLQNNLHVIELDLASLASIFQFAQEIHHQYEQPIDYLFNNAAIMALPQYTESVDGFEQQIGVNYLGHFYLTNLLIDKLIQTRDSNQVARVISVSSRAHKYATKPFKKAVDMMENALWDQDVMQIGYGDWKNYGISKGFQIFFARELQRRFGKKGAGLISVSLHPGVIKSGLQQHLSDEYIATKEFDKNIEQGAATQLWLALMPEGDMVPGGYYVDCQYHDDWLREDLNPGSRKGIKRGFEMMGAKLWEISRKLIEKKGFTFPAKKNDDKDEL